MHRAASLALTTIGAAAFLAAAAIELALATGPAGICRVVGHDPYWRPDVTSAAWLRSCARCHLGLGRWTPAT
jgi:hypothetical protein